jgi:hypothetical protein
MPRHIKLIAYWGNGLLAAAFTVFALALLFKGQPGMSLFFLLLSALGLFNIYVIRKAAYFLSEEQWLEAELRKAEIREKLKALGRALPGGGGGRSPNQDSERN